MQITKAVITAAGRGARQYPASDTVQKAMLPLVDRDGLTKPVLQIIAEEALESGIEEIWHRHRTRRRSRLSQSLSQLCRQPSLDLSGRRLGRRTSPTARSTWSSGCDSPFSPSPTATATRSGALGTSWATSRFCSCSATIFIFRRSRGDVRGS